MSRVMAAQINASPVAHSQSWSFPMRRLWEIHAKVR
jgi:hypothetical protein